MGALNVRKQEIDGGKARKLKKVPEEKHHASLVINEFLTSNEQFQSWRQFCLALCYSMVCKFLAPLRYCCFLWKEQLNGCMLTPLSGASNNNPSRPYRHKSPRSCFCRSIQASVCIFTIRQSAGKEQSGRCKHLCFPRADA
jgi:hypothetical protein